MDVDLNTARAIASLSFVLNVACQTFYATQKLTDAHDSAFSPNPYFIAAFLVLQFTAQLFFIRGLFSVTDTPDEPTLSESTPLAPAHSTLSPVEPIQTQYSIILALGNLFHVIWTVLWVHTWFWAALPVIISITLLHSYISIVYLIPYTPEYADRYEFPAHVISKLGAGVGCLGILNTAATAAGYVGPPSAAAQVFFAFLFVILASVYDENGFFQVAILFDTLALWAGQPTWSPSLRLAAGFIVLRIYSDFLSPWAGE